MPTNFPNNIDTYTTKVDGVSDVLAADTNNLQDAVRALQIKVGVNASGDASSLDARVAAAASAAASAVTTATVLTATAGASAGGVGTYAFAHGVTGSPGTTAAGASLYTSSRVGQWGPTLSGTWRCMGHADVSDRTTLWLRIS